jgi:hypothetical protein
MTRQERIREARCRRKAAREGYWLGEPAAASLPAPSTENGPERSGDARRQ